MTAASNFISLFFHTGNKHYFKYISFHFHPETFSQKIHKAFHQQEIATSVLSWLDEQIQMVISYFYVFLQLFVYLSDYYNFFGSIKYP